MKRKLIILSGMLTMLGVLGLAMFMVMPKQSSGDTTGLSAKFTHNIEYTVRDANGVIKDHQVYKNATSENLLGDAIRRLSRSGINTDDVYTGIALCETNDANAGAQNGFEPSGLGDSCEVSEDMVGANPATDSLDVDSQTVSSGSNDSNPSYVVSNLFEADSSTTIEEIQLVKGLSVDSADVGAARDVLIGLDSFDKLEITWTVSIE